MTKRFEYVWRGNEGGGLEEVDDGGSSPYTVRKVHLTSSQILNLATVPVDVGLPVAANTLIVPARTAALTTPGGTPYAGGDNINLGTTGGWEIGVIKAQDLRSTDPFLDYCSYWDFLMGSIDVASLPVADFFNQPWTLTVANGTPFTDGDGTIELLIDYLTFDFS